MNNVSYALRDKFKDEKAQVLCQMPVSVYLRGYLAGKGLSDSIGIVTSLYINWLPFFKIRASDGPEYDVLIKAGVIEISGGYYSLTDQTTDIINKYKG